MYVDLDSNTSILLQTAIAQVSRVHQLHPVVNMCILFDSGSQRSYISERAKAKLNLPPKRKQKLLIKMFGQENEQLKECDLVEFCVGELSESSKVQMTALAVPLPLMPLLWFNPFFHFKSTFCLQHFLFHSTRFTFCSTTYCTAVDQKKLFPSLHRVPVDPHFPPF